MNAEGSTTIRQIAINFLVHDSRSQATVVSRNADLITLFAGKLTFEQKAHLKMLCERRLQEFVKKRGLPSGTVLSKDVFATG